MEGKKRVAIYCRLSQEDRKKYNDVDESESIQNQKTMLIAHTLKMGWDLYGIFFDDDRSGMDPNRPDWLKMLALGEKGEYDIVLCKTQSRFTRDMEMVEKYLHHDFKLWNIRFVSIVDNVDTNIKGNKKSRQINGLVNQWYVEDTSDSVKASLQTMRESGKYIAATSLYGYTRDPRDKSKIIIDEVAGKVVQRIFASYISGLSTKKIANMLNEEKILPPAMYKKEYMILTYNHFKIRDTWTVHMIRRILKNEMYTGKMIQGKTCKPDIKDKRTICLPKSEWTVVENTHNLLVSQEDYDIVKNLLISNAKSDTNIGERHLFSGKLVCLDCGTTMRKRKSHGINPYFVCRANKELGTCSDNHIINQKELLQIVTVKIQERIDESVDKNLLSENAQKKNYSNEIKQITLLKEKINNSIQKKKNSIRQLYEDKAEGIISNGEYLEFKEEFSNQKDKFEQQLQLLSKREDDILKQETNCEVIESLIEKYSNIDIVTSEILNSFISQIKIGVRPINR